MPAQHGQTYDPQEEPSPHGGWFRLEERPYPERLDKGFRRAAAIIAATITLLAAGVVIYGAAKGASILEAGPFVLLAFIAAAMAYGFTRGIGMVVTGIYGTLRDGSEFVVDWRAVRHDLPLRRTWIVILEGALLLAAACTSLWGLFRFMKQGDTLGLATFAVIQCMTYWPLIRRRIAAGRTRG